MTSFMNAPSTYKIIITMFPWQEWRRPEFRTFEAGTWVRDLSVLWVLLRWCHDPKNENTMKLGYNDLGYNENSDITNKLFGPKCSFTTQIDPVITNPGYN